MRKKLFAIMFLTSFAIIGINTLENYSGEKNGYVTIDAYAADREYEEGDIIEKEEKNGGTWEFEVNEDEKTVTFNDYFDFTDNPKSELEIPEKVEGYTVTGIAKLAFYNNKEYVKSIKIPDTVETIGEMAFEDCVKLKSIEIPGGVKEIRDDTFNGCTELESVKLPEGLEVIGNDAFNGCSKLKKIELPKSLKELAGGSSILVHSGSAFEGCKKLESIKIPDGVEEIPVTTFKDCTSLKKITIPESVKEISDDAFEGCNKNLKIYGKKGSEAEKFAKENGYKFKTGAGKVVLICIIIGLVVIAAVSAVAILTIRRKKKSI